MPKEQAWTVEAFRDGLRDLGYVEGKNIVIEWRLSDKVAELDASRQLAAELVHLEVDLIVAAGTPASRAAIDATDKIPVIFAPAGDPVSSGLAASLARPGKTALVYP
jgi:putative ABC transport system substrate-binding protein